MQLASVPAVTTISGRFWRRFIRSVVSLGAAALAAKVAGDTRLLWLTPVLQGVGKVVRDKVPAYADLVPF